MSHPTPTIKRSPSQSDVTLPPPTGSLTQAPPSSLRPPFKTRAPSPWDGRTPSAKVNAILETTDYVDFYVWKELLIVFSDEFAKILVDTPSTTPGPSSYPPLYRVPVASRVLEVILTVCYDRIHNTTSRPLHLREDDVFAVVKAGRWFGIPVVVALAEDNLRRLAIQDPWKIYGLSRQHNWEAGARISAQATLRPPRSFWRTPENASSVSTVLHSANALLSPYEIELHQAYHRECARAVSRVVCVTESRYNSMFTIKWIEAANAVWFTCDHYSLAAYDPVEIGGRRHHYARRWFTTSLRNLRYQLLQYPSPETVLQSKSQFVALGVEECTSARCQDRVKHDVEAFLDQLANRVQKALDDVSPFFSD